MRNKGTRNNRATEGFRKGLVHKGAEPRSEQIVIGTYLDDKIGVVVKRLAGPPEFCGYHAVSYDFDADMDLF